MNLKAIIENLESQLEDRIAFIDDDEPDNIFRQDAEALSATIGILRELETGPDRHAEF